MTEQYLPQIYSRFRERFPELSENLGALAQSANAGPLDERTSRLVKLGIAIGAMSEGAVRSNARRALQAGATHEEVLHVVALTVTTRGFPAAVASYSWIEEVLAADGPHATVPADSQQVADRM
jgi:alkylhydroperoxidase/carboxymuconolactone decarboxylase family protein YurZ